MSETTTSKDNKKEPLKLSRPGRLELRKTVETGQVRQSFSHGRSKAVTVEVKRKRTFAPGEGGRMTEVTVEAAPEETAVAAATELAAEALPDLEAERAAKLTDAERAMLDDIQACSAAGSPSTVREGLADFVARTGVDEVIVASQIYDHEARARSYEILADLAAPDRQQRAS